MLRQDTPGPTAPAADGGSPSAPAQTVATDSSTATQQPQTTAQKEPLRKQPDPRATRAHVAEAKVVYGQGLAHDIAPPWRQVKAGGALVASPQANAEGKPCGPGDGLAHRVAVADRAGLVLRLSRDGWSLRAIGERVGCSAPLVRKILAEALAERSSTNALEAEQVRLIIADRLDDSRKALLSIARGEPQPIGGREAARKRARGEAIPCSVPTVGERIAAQRTLAGIEEQRARLLGVAARGAMGDLADWLTDLAGRRSATDAETIDGNDL